MKAVFDDGAILIYFRPWVVEEKEEIDRVLPKITREFPDAEVGSDCILVDENATWGDYKEVQRWLELQKG